MSTELKLTVKAILEKAQHYVWQVQGLGMLRTYLSKEVRLHVWDPDLIYPGVSTLHDHPWSFTSHVVAGSIRNVMYRKAHRTDPVTTLMKCQAIQCGVGGGPIEEPRIEALVCSSDCISAGGMQGRWDTYAQLATDIHETIAEPGTVTIVTRTFEKDEETAHVYFPHDKEFVSAMPRLATEDEIQRTTKMSLARWF